jgi:Flp pilus assembly protein CpaB
MEAIKQRPSAAPKKRSASDSFKQFVSTRRGAYTVAFAAAALAGLVLLVFINRYKDDVHADLKPAPVLTADRLIPRGTAAADVIANKLFEATPVATENIKPGAITESAQILGKVSVREILPGQQITAADFAEFADPIRSRLTKRERAIEIPMDKIHGLLGTLRPGDHVDILGAFNSATQNAGGVPILHEIVRDIRVMQNNGSSVILETTDTQGAALAFASENARLWFLLRPTLGATDSRDITISQDSLIQQQLGGSSGSDSGTATVDTTENP